MLQYFNILKKENKKQQQQIQRDFKNDFYLMPYTKYSITITIHPYTYIHTYN